MDKQELRVLSMFRSDARMNLTTISRMTGVPVSTLFDRLKKYEGTIIKKHTCLLDFNKLGYELRVNMLLKVAQQNRDQLKEYLTKNQSVNSVFRVVGNGFDFIIECIFKNMGELQIFAESLEKFNIKARQDYYVLEDIKREEFMADEQLVDLLVSE